MNYIKLRAAFAVLIGMGCAAILAQEAGTTYNRIDEVMDWGAATTRLIVDLGAEAPKGAVGPDSFSVHVSRSDPGLEEPFLEEGIRKVIEAYISPGRAECAVPRDKAVASKRRMHSLSTLVPCRTWWSPSFRNARISTLTAYTLRVRQMVAG